MMSEWNDKAKSDAKRVELRQRIRMIPWPGMENCYVVISGQWPDNRHEMSKPHMTFTAVDWETGVAAEWDGEYGPIQLAFRAANPGDTPSGEFAAPCWIFENSVRGLHWSQRAVRDHDLARSFVNGDYDHIFAVLGSWLSHSNNVDRVPDND